MRALYRPKFVLPNPDQTTNELACHVAEQSRRFDIVVRTLLMGIRISRTHKPVERRELSSSLRESPKFVVRLSDVCMALHLIELRPSIWQLLEKHVDMCTSGRGN